MSFNNFKLVISQDYNTLKLQHFSGHIQVINTNTLQLFNQCFKTLDADFRSANYCDLVLLGFKFKQDFYLLLAMPRMGQN